ncbi:MAG: class I SAM-dependent DNA methyltransferase [Candidatus Heimdallarchaeota archaeon]
MHSAESQALRGLQRNLLQPRILLKDLGTESDVCRRTIRAFYDALVNPSKPQTLDFFNEWKKILAQTCAYSAEKIQGLERGFDLPYNPEEIDFEKLLFAAQTYFALILKLLSLEAATLFADSDLTSFLLGLRESARLDPETIRPALRSMETGLAYADLGITNFIDGDMFSWYETEWRPSVSQPLCRIIEILSDYEIAAYEREQVAVSDLFKHLYQGLFPRELRHDLGEFYTPDWLAELILDEAGFTLDQFEALARKKGDAFFPLRLKLLDPACGSGTFLLSAIKRLRKYTMRHRLQAGVLETICQSVVGFDLNPVAVIASKANYLLSIVGLLQYRKGSIEIPIYLTDTIHADKSQNFDYVVGNPPWVGWEHLSATYRAATKQVWVAEGLISKAKGKSGIGRIKKELACLFIVRSLRHLLKKGGILSLLFPFTILKAPADAEFRQVLSSIADVQVIHDFVSVRPFEGATTRAASLHARKGKTVFPIKCISWKRRPGEKLDYNISLEEVRGVTERCEMILAPLAAKKPATPWMILPDSEILDQLRKTIGPSNYLANAGTYTGLNGSYVVKVIGKQGNNLLIENIPEAGKKLVPKLTNIVIPSDYVYPLLRGKDIKRWQTNPSLFVVIPPSKREEVPNNDHLRLLSNFFENFAANLVRRRGLPFKTTLKPLRGRLDALGWEDGKTSFQIQQELLAHEPFYFYVFNSKPSLSKWKVVWQDTAGKISGRGAFVVAAMGPLALPPLSEKPVIPLHTVMQIGVESEDEAHFLAAALNSPLARLIVAAYTMERHISTSPVKWIPVPKFDPSCQTHVELSQIGRTLADSGNQRSFKRIHKQLDAIAAKLFGLTQSEMQKVNVALKILMGTE